MINNEQAHLDIAAASHPGMSGKKNEDRYGVSAFMTGTQSDVPAVFAILCDGIGGHRAGEVAAQMGVTIISEMVTASDGAQPLKTLEHALKRANHAIYEESLSDQGRKGMGATCACAWVIADRLYTANLGDSRIYLLRAGHIMQLTTDHTWLQEAYDAGVMDEIRGEAHPNAHVIRRYLGAAKAPQPDFRLWFFEGEADAEALDNQGLPLEPGDVLLVCSDGLTDLVSDEEIHDLVMSTPFDKAPSALIDLANARGGHDNISLVLLGVPQTPVAAVQHVRKRRGLLGCLVGLLLLGMLAVALYFGLRWRAERSERLIASPPAQTQPLPTQPLATLPATIESTPTPALTETLGVEVGLTPPLPTLTPWPTHTLSP
jgi:protein phosphatase